MMIFSSVPATIKSRLAFLISVVVGFTIYFPSILETLTSEIGPLKGISDTAMAAEAAKAAKASG